MLAVVLAWLVASSGAPQAAPEPVLALDWETNTPGCPARPALVERLAQLVPELPPPATLAEAPAARLRVSGRIARGEAEGLEVSLRFESSAGVDERRFQGHDCRALSDAAALVIAVAIDPLAVATVIADAEVAARPTTDAPEPTSPPAPRPIREEDPDDDLTIVRSEPADPRPRARQPRGWSSTGSSGPRRRADLRVGVAAFAGGGYGPTNAGFAAVGGDVALLGRQWRASVTGRWHPPRILALTGGDVRHEAFAFGLRGCGVPSWRTLEFPLCATVELGSVRARGVGTTPDPQTAGLLSAALTPSAGLRWVLDERVALGLDFGVPISLVRGGFSINDAIVSRLSAAGVLALAMVELRF